MMNDALRAAIAADLAPIAPLPSPARRVVTVVPLALLLLVSAPLVFEFRDVGALGWTWSWGASVAQVLAGLLLVTLALRDAVPGRGWPAWAVIGAVALVVAAFLVITSGAWYASPVSLRRFWWQIGAICLVGSATSALPAVVLGAVLVVRAFPLHPIRTGALAGLAGGLFADAGWRLFCHFSEPSHVVAAHLGGVLAATLCGALLTRWMTRRTTRVMRRVG